MNSKAIIAERTLEILNHSEKISIQIMKPQPDEREGGDWECTFFIRLNRNIEQQTIYGIDSFQALCLAIKIIPSYLSNFLNRMDVKLHPDEKVIMDNSEI